MASVRSKTSEKESGVSGISGNAATETLGTQNASDEQLVTRVLEGDAEVFETLVLRYQDRIYNLLRRMSGSDSDAEDLTQEAFLKAYKALSSFRHGSQFFTWLYRIAVNTALSRGRQSSRRNEVMGASLDAPIKGSEDGGGSMGDRLADPTSADPSAGMEQDQIRKRVQEGLAQLDPEYRSVILLRDMEGMDYEQIMETLGLSRPALKSRLHRARAELARILKDLNPAES